MKKANSPAKEKVEYNIEVIRGKEIKNGLVVFDMNVNGITIYGCWYREYKNKDGEEGTMISFPSEKGNDDKYYNHCWFPLSAENKDNIIAQLEKVVD